MKKIVLFFCVICVICVFPRSVHAQAQVTNTPRTIGPITCINAVTVPTVSPLVPGSTGYIPNFGQIAHTVTYTTSGTIKGFQIELDASDVDPQIDNTKWVQIGSIATQPGSGVVKADEYHPFIRCSVPQVFGGGSVTAKYTANAATNGPPTGLALTSAINRVVASATQAKFSTFGTTPISTPGGGGGGLIYFTFSDASCSGSTISVQIGPDVNHLTTWVAATTLNNITSTQTIVVPSAPASVVSVFYATGCGAAATTFDATYAFSNNVASSTTPVGATSCTITVANEAITGTVLNGLAKLTGAPSTAIQTTFLDTAGGAVGIVTGGAGATGNATITTCGLVPVNFDGATTAGDYVAISGGPAGTATDAGPTYPASNEVLGRVLTTNAAPGLFTIDEFPPEMRGGGGAAGCTPPGTTDGVVFENPMGACDASNNFAAFPSGVSPNEVVAVQLSNDSTFEIDRTIDTAGHNQTFMDGTDIELHSTGANGSGSAGTIQSFIFDDDWAADIFGVETITNVAITNNVLDITCVQNPCNNGPYMRFAGLTTAAFLNGAFLALAAASGAHAYFVFTHANYASAADTGTIARQRSSNPIPFLTTSSIDLAGGNMIAYDAEIGDGVASPYQPGTRRGFLAEEQGGNSRGTIYGFESDIAGQAPGTYNSQGGEAAAFYVKQNNLTSGHSYALKIEQALGGGSPALYVYQQGDTYTRGTLNFVGTTTVGTCTISAGLNDCTSSLNIAGGGPPATETINIKICTTGLADSFDWAVGATPSCNTPVQMNSGGGSNLIGNDDVKITWGATTGHTLAATAAIVVTVPKSTISGAASGGASIAGSWQSTVSLPNYAVNIAGGTTDIGTTNIVASVSANSMWHISVALNCTATSAAATENVTIGWTDTGSQAQTLTLGSAVVCTALGAASVGSIDFNFRAKAATAITYATTRANTPTWDLSIALDQRSLL